MNMQVEEIPKSEVSLEPIKHLRWSFCANIVNGLKWNIPTGHRGLK